MLGELTLQSQVSVPSQGSLRVSCDKPRQCIKKHRHCFADKGPYSQSYGFSSSHVQMWELDHKEDWLPENWCFWTLVLKNTLESPLDSKEVKLVNLKGKQPWIFIGRTDAKSEAPIHWPPNAKSQLFGKDPNAGKDWGQEEKKATQDEIVVWHHQLNGHEFEQTPGVSEGQEAWYAAVHGVTKSWTHLSHWITRTTDISGLPLPNMCGFPSTVHIYCSEVLSLRD